MSLQETLNSTFEVFAGPADAAVHEYIYVVNASAEALRAMMGMSAEQYARYVDGVESPAAYAPTPEDEASAGSSDLVAKNGEAWQATQDDLATNRANLARDVANAEASFGRLTSNVPAFDALPQRNNKTHLWN